MPIYPSRKKKRNFFPLIISILGAIAVYLWGGLILGWLFSPTVRLASPVSRFNTFLASGFVNFGASFRSKQNLITDNRQLAAENLRLKLRLAILREELEGKEELEKILGRTKETRRPIVASVVIAPGSTPYDSLLIDVGSVNGGGRITVGDTVVYDGHILLGRVVEVRANRSKVKLLSAAGDDVSVLVGDGNIPATAKSLGSGNFSIKLPKGSEVKAGDTVITSVDGKSYLVGLVDLVEKNTNNPFQTIMLKSPVNIYQLRWIEVYDSEA